MELWPWIMKQNFTILVIRIDSHKTKYVARVKGRAWENGCYTGTNESIYSYQPEILQQSRTRRVASGIL